MYNLEMPIATIEMTGTEKQQSWALDIRRANIKTAMITINRCINNPAFATNADAQTQVKMCQAGIDRAMQITDAKWWIDNRNQNICVLIGKGAI
jgi:hypothetical protein